MIRAGELRHRLEVQQKSTVLSDTGTPEDCWITTCYRWAKIEPLTGREMFLAQQVLSETTHKVTMRPFTLYAKDRLKFGTRVFNIVNILNAKEINETLVVHVKEVI